ncbi:MAG: efflux RND transporter periplasmic adaptor subunit [Beijerinckiaceae bacterium]
MSRPVLSRLPFAFSPMAATRLSAISMAAVMVSLGLAVVSPLQAADATEAKASQTTPASQASAQAPAISVVRVGKAEVAETVFVNGTLVARDEILIGPEVDGYRIVELLADEGDRVVKDQILARLSRETLLIQLEQNAATLSRLDATMEQAKYQITQTEADANFSSATLNRTRQLGQEGFASKEVLDQKVANARSAQARLASAKEGLQLAEAEKKATLAQRKDIELRLARTDIRAPAAGMITRRTAKVGAIAAGAGDPLFRMTRDGIIELEGDVAETTLARLRNGQTVTVLPSSSEEGVSGKVRLVSPEVNRTTRLGRVRIALDSPERLAVGSFARATIEIARKTALTIPQSALSMNGERFEVQSVVNGVVETRTVQPGLRGRGVVQIESGLNEGDFVIAIAGTFVRNGDRVTPIEKTQ